MTPGQRKALLGAAGVGAGLVAYRGLGESRGAQLATTDLANQRRMDLSTPIPDFSHVKAAYEQFRKRAAEGSPWSHVIAGEAMKGVGIGAGAAATGLLVAKPLSVIGDLLKRKFYTDPKRRQVLDEVIRGDEDLSRSNKMSPEVIAGAHNTLKRFAPSITEDPSSLRAYLRHAVTTGGTIDPASIKSLADLELTHRRAKGESK